jgi:hypothetical protein
MGVRGWSKIAEDRVTWKLTLKEVRILYVTYSHSRDRKRVIHT